MTYWLPKKTQDTVQRILNGEILEEPLLDVNVNGEDERGLLGIAVSKNSTFDKTYVFLFYTEGERGTQVNEEDGDNEEEPTSNGDGGQPIGNRLYRYELSENGSKLVNPKLAFRFAISARSGSQWRSHNHRS